MSGCTITGEHNQYLMVLQVGEDVDSYGRYKVYDLHLLDIHSGEYWHILSDYISGGVTQMLWSPDGATLAFLGAHPKESEQDETIGGVLISHVLLGQ